MKYTIKIDYQPGDKQYFAVCSEEAEGARGSTAEEAETKLIEKLKILQTKPPVIYKEIEI